MSKQNKVSQRLSRAEEKEMQRCIASPSYFFYKYIVIKGQDKLTETEYQNSIKQIEYQQKSPLKLRAHYKDKPLITNKMKVMNYKEFVETHRPVINNLDVKAKFDGTLFNEHYEGDIAFVWNIALSKGVGLICGVIKVKDDYFITNDPMGKEKIGYFILTNPFRGEDILIN